MAKIRVRIQGSQTVHYSQVVEMSEREFNRLDNADYEVLQERVAELIDTTQVISADEIDDVDISLEPDPLHGEQAREGGAG
jgi:hypothetical protein